MSDREQGAREAVVLDYLPHGRADDDRPQYKKPSLVHAMGVDRFRLVEAVVDDDAEVTIGDRIDLDSDVVQSVRDVSYDDLSGGAQNELDYAVDELIATDEQRFVDFYNEAQPITLRLHQLDLLPGIGKKLRNAILEERKRRPFNSFLDLEDRVSGLHNPREKLEERIQEELRDDDLKYRSFVTKAGDGDSDGDGDD